MAFLLKSYFKLLKIFKNITLILNNKDIRNINIIIFKDNKIFTFIKINKGNRTINIIMNKLYKV